MDGPEAAGEALRVELAARLPAKVAQLEQRLGLPAGRIPAPAQVLAGNPTEHERIELDQFPTVMVIVQGIAGVRVADVDDGLVQYAVTYPVRVYSVVRGGEVDDEELSTSTDLLRKRYALAITEVLLARLEAGQVDPLSLTASYSDVGVDPELGATIAASFVTVNIERMELLDDLAQLGVANTVDVELATIPHPAAD